MGGMYVNFRAGELVNTEYSYKYYPHEYSALARRAGLQMKRLWQDEHCHYSVMYFVPMPGINSRSG
jgi:uncharacterized SAM-dependent methyltransferase